MSHQENERIRRQLGSDMIEAQRRFSERRAPSAAPDLLASGKEFLDRVERGEDVPTLPAPLRIEFY